MSKLGSQKNPARIRVQTEQRGMELFALCEANGWKVIIGIEPDNTENIEDLKKLEAGIKPLFEFQSSPSRNAACPCGSEKQYKRCCGK
jgi:SWIM/SEC-C metal-binding protein